MTNQELDAHLVVWWDGRKDGRNGGLLCCAEPELREDTSRPVEPNRERGEAAVEILKTLAVRGAWGTRTVYQRAE